MADGAELGRRWIAVTLKGVQKESIACRWIENAGYKPILPLEKYYGRKRHGKRERTKKERLAIRGYVFIEIPPGMSEADLARDVRDDVDLIRRPVGVNNKPLVIQEGWLERLNPALLDPDWIEEPRLKIGDAIHLGVDAGAWAGWKGQVENINGRQLKVLLKSLQTALTISVPEEWALLAA